MSPVNGHGSPAIGDPLKKSEKRLVLRPLSTLIFTNLSSVENLWKTKIKALY